MISVPVVTEAQVKSKLVELGYDPTEIVAATGRFWKHRDGSRHLMVPFPADGFYPDWLLEEVAQRARLIGDEIAADSLRVVSGWARMRAKPSRAKGKRS